MLEQNKFDVFKTLPDLKLELDEKHRLLQQLEKSRATISDGRYLQLKETYLSKIEDYVNRIKLITNDINNELIDADLQSEKNTEKIKIEMDALAETELLFNTKVISEADYKVEKKRLKKNFLY